MLTHRFYQSQEQTIHVVGGLDLAPVSAPDTLQLDVTDAWRVRTHINTLRHRMKSPYLTLGFSAPPPASSFCSLGVCDQMWPYYKFNKDAEMRLSVCPCLCVKRGSSVWEALHI